MAGPIKPEEVADLKIKTIPEEVFTVFNEQIAKNFSGNGATVYQDKVMEILTSERFNFGRREVFDNKWLDVEEAYRAAGWKVRYDKPGFNESYEAYFEFTRKK